MASRLQTIARRAQTEMLAVGDSWRSRHAPEFSNLVSQAASAAQVRDPRFAYWTDVLHHPVMFHRKLWEWCYALQAIDQTGHLHHGTRALGFGVGTEPLPAVLAARGVEVLATDQPSEGAGDWAVTQQHAASLDALVREDICAREKFLERVRFQAVDMRSIPADLRGFDVLWSSCCFEHLGSPQAGFDYVLAGMDCLRPGGLAVHTTEFDVRNSRRVVDLGSVVLYRRRDLASLAKDLRQRGHRLRCNFYLGREHPEDQHVDQEPYTDIHLRLELGPTVATSFGIIIEKGER